jgi:hypothetical protein
VMSFATTVNSAVNKSVGVSDSVDEPQAVIKIAIRTNKTNGNFFMSQSLLNHRFDLMFKASDSLNGMTDFLSRYLAQEDPAKWPISV